MQKQKILFAIGSLDVGGAEKQMVSLIKELVRCQYQCNVFVLNGNGKLGAELKAMGVQVTSAWSGGDSKRRPWRTFIALIRFTWLTLRCKPDVLHAYLPLITFFGALAGRLCNVPLVVTGRRALGTHQQRYPLLRLLDLLANALSHRITVNSRAVWNDVVRRDRVDPQKLVLIHNAVETRAFVDGDRSRPVIRGTLGLQPDHMAIIVLANLIPYKGHSDLLESMALVLKKIPQARLLVVGDDRGIQSCLERQVVRLRMGHAVRFLGQRGDIPQLLAASDLSVLASHEEGFSNVILESMAAGLPVVATDVGGNREAIVHGETGWLVPPRKPSVLAERMIDLLTDDNKAKMWGLRGKQRVRELFSPEKMLSAHIALYNTANSTTIAPSICSGRFSVESEKKDRST